MEDVKLSKIIILIQQHKHNEAEKILKELLFKEPNNINYLSLLSEIKIHQNLYDEAESIINNAIGLAPEYSHLFYIKSRINIHKKQYDQSEKNIKQAIEMDPHDPEYFAWWSSLKLARKDYKKALELANTALEYDAENILALNNRSQALLKLDDKEASFKTIEGALREDPNNAYTHSNFGWGLLEKGEHQKALSHFKEALTHDPQLDHAKAGMIEALKAKNLIYRLFLKYSFWIGNLTAKYQWGVIIGFYLGVRGLRSLANTNEQLQPYLTPLIILLSLIAFSTWVITPISNLFLRFNSFGKLLLNQNEIKSSNFVAGSFILFLTALLLFFTTNSLLFFAIAVFGFTMMVPFSVMFSPSKFKHALLIYALVMGVIGIGAIGTAVSTRNLFNELTTIYIFGFIGFQWIYNFLTIKEDHY